MRQDTGTAAAYRADGELLVPVAGDTPADALFGAVARLADAAARRPAHPALPFALDALCVGPDATRAAFAWVRPADGAPARDDVLRLDVDLCDGQGEVLVQARGLAFDAIRVTAAVPVPELAPAVAPVAARPVIALADPATDTANPPAPVARGPVQITLH